MAFSDLLKSIGAGITKLASPAPMPGGEGKYMGPSPIEQMVRGLEKASAHFEKRDIGPVPLSLAPQIKALQPETPEQVLARHRAEDESNIQQQTAMKAQLLRELEEERTEKHREFTRGESKVTALRNTLGDVRSAIAAKAKTLDPEKDKDALERLKQEHWKTYETEREALEELGVQYPKELTAKDLLTTQFEEDVALARSKANASNAFLAAMQDPNATPEQRALAEQAFRVSQLGIKDVGPLATTSYELDQVTELPVKVVRQWDQVSGKWVETRDVVKPSAVPAGQYGTLMAAYAPGIAYEATLHPQTGGATGLSPEDQKRRIDVYRANVNDADTKAKDRLNDFLRTSEEEGIVGLKAQITTEQQDAYMTLHSLAELDRSMFLSPEDKLMAMNDRLEDLKKVGSVEVLIPNPNDPDEPIVDIFGKGATDAFGKPLPGVNNLFEYVIYQRDAIVNATDMDQNTATDQVLALLRNAMVQNVEARKAILRRQKVAKEQEAAKKKAAEKKAKKPDRTFLR